MKLQIKTLAYICGVGAFTLLAACQPSGNKNNAVTKVAGQSNGSLAQASGTISGSQVIAQLYQPSVTATADGTGNNVFQVRAAAVIQIPAGKFEMDLSTSLTQDTISKGGAVQNLQPLGIPGVTFATQITCVDASQCQYLLVSVIVVSNGNPSGATQFGFIYSTLGQNVAQAQGGFSALASYMFPQVTNATNIVAFPDVTATLMSTVQTN